jgi:hypothetical protein
MTYSSGPKKALQMDLYELGKDIQELRQRISALEAAQSNREPNGTVDRGGDGPIGTLGERTQLVLANHTFRDFHIQLGGDVHEGNWGPEQINHNGEREAKSKKIDFGDWATYAVTVFRNNAGVPGDVIGETFEHKVRYNAAGTSDRLEFGIVTIGGQTYLEAVSVRRVARVALFLWLGV